MLMNGAKLVSRYLGAIAVAALLVSMNTSAALPAGEDPILLAWSNTGSDADRSGTTPGSGGGQLGRS